MINKNCKHNLKCSLAQYFDSNVTKSRIDWIKCLSQPAVRMTSRYIVITT